MWQNKKFTHLKHDNSLQKYGPCWTPHAEHKESSKYGSIWNTFRLNLDDRTSINAAVTALKYEWQLLNVTRADPNGYLCLSVSMPTKENHHQFIYFFIFSPFNSIPA